VDYTILLLAISIISRNPLPMTSSAQYQTLFLAASSPLFTYSPFLTARTSNDGSWTIPSATNSSTQDPLLAATLASVQSGLVGADVNTGGGSSNASAVSLNGVSGKYFLHDELYEDDSYLAMGIVSHGYYTFLFFVKHLYSLANFTDNRPESKDGITWLWNADRSGSIN
jgi:hypothetical protein